MKKLKRKACYTVTFFVERLSRKPRGLPTPFIVAKYSILNDAQLEGLVLRHPGTYYRLEACWNVKHGHVRGLPTYG